MLMLKFVTDPMALDEAEALEMKRRPIQAMVPKIGNPYRVMKRLGIVCLAPGYSRDQHRTLSLHALPHGAEFKLERPTANFMNEHNVTDGTAVVFHYHEGALPSLTTTDGRDIELHECINCTQLRLISMPSTTH